MPDSPAPIRFGTLAGIRTVAVPGDGPFRATLTFRVGRADESFANGGITHFVEHLALSGPISSDDVEHNGSVDPTTTAFWARGDRARVLAHVQKIVRNLGRLPVDRIEIERDILRAEMDGWSSGPIGTLAAFRFGARAHGLIGYQQYGLRTVDARQLQAWADHWFTRNNAVLVIEGEPPSSLELPLPPGTPMHPAAPSPIAWRSFPSEAPVGPGGGVAVGMLAPRTAAAAAAARILNDRLMQRLRHDAGVSYGPAATWIPLSATVAHLALLADVREPAAAATARDLIEELCDDLVAHGPSERELASARTPFDESESPLATATSWAHYAAHQALFGMSRQSMADHAAEVRALTADQIRDTFAPAFATRMVAIPDNVRRGSLPPMQMSSPISVDGARYRPRDRGTQPGVSLTAGNDGLMVESSQGTFTVTFANCVGVLSWHDGTRTVFDADGTFVEVDPAEWRDGSLATSLIDERIPAALNVPMDQEVERRAEYVAEATRDLVRRTDATAVGLDLLAEVLQEGEILETAAEAAVGRARGVVAITDWRVLFLADRQSVLLLQRGDVVSADVRRGASLLGGDAKLTLEMADGTRYVIALPGKGPAAARVHALLSARVLSPSR